MQNEIDVLLELVLSCEHNEPRRQMKCVFQKKKQWDTTDLFGHKKKKIHQIKEKKRNKIRI